MTTNALNRKRERGVSPSFKHNLAPLQTTNHNIFRTYFIYINRQSNHGYGLYIYRVGIFYKSSISIFNYILT